MLSLVSFFRQRQLGTHSSADLRGPDRAFWPCGHLFAGGSRRGHGVSGQGEAKPAVVSEIRWHWFRGTDSQKLRQNICVPGQNLGARVMLAAGGVRGAVVPAPFVVGL